MAMIKLAADDTGLTFADMLNSEKALSVIMAIFLSVRSHSYSAQWCNISPD